ncbi:MaoC family dehydratase [Marinobacter zhejiangensis]|uniref:Acyl dehydratase n=1 Tax=Marinobacter zhejiangensis TaxID=488535 RepID=A0A1I4M511_9GAMM|nr:MaoC family dehydratase [Marinobacter zhejiangensis]SFL98067.1 Acyl dehydratase [Marinobacter zhejiangensis]
MLTIALNVLTDYTGVTLGCSPWTSITQERVNTFADATGDHQWIHVDVDRATQESPWKSPVAHGFLTLSMLPALNQQVFTITGTAASINYGMNKVRFPSAVKVGAKVRSNVELLSAEPQDASRVLACYRTTVEILGEDRPACVVESLVMYVSEE